MKKKHSWVFTMVCHTHTTEKGKIPSCERPGAEGISTFRGRKNRFCFIWLHWIQIFNIKFPSNNSEIFKSNRFIEKKRYFQMKVNKLGRCHNLGPGQIPRGSFAATAHDFHLHVIPYLVCIVHFKKITRRSSLLVEKSSLTEKSRAEKIPC